MRAPRWLVTMAAILAAVAAAVAGALAALEQDRDG